MILFLLRYVAPVLLIALTLVGTVWLVLHP